MHSDPAALLKRMYATLVELCPHPLTPEGMHGAFAGVALSPRPAVPNTWLPVLYNMPGEMPEFADRDQAKNFLDTAVLAYNGVVASLTGGEFDFPFPVEAADGAELAGHLQAWCEGFIRGLRCTGVEAADYDQDFVNLMSPIAYCARPDFFDNAGSEEAQEATIRRIAEEMPANLTALRNYFYIQLQRQRAAGARRPGRNDPCSCGSGKKYKHCCGKSESGA